MGRHRRAAAENYQNRQDPIPQFSPPSQKSLGALAATKALCAPDAGGLNAIFQRQFAETSTPATAVLWR
jgi:hypothetical protein